MRFLPNPITVTLFPATHSQFSNHHNFIKKLVQALILSAYCSQSTGMSMIVTHLRSQPIIIKKFYYRRISYGHNTLENTTSRLSMHRRMAIGNHFVIKSSVYMYFQVTHTTTFINVQFVIFSSYGSMESGRTYRPFARGVYLSTCTCVQKQLDFKSAVYILVGTNTMYSYRRYRYPVPAVSVNPVFPQKSVELDWIMLLVRKMGSASH